MGNLSDKIKFFKENAENDYKFENLPKIKKLQQFSKNISEIEDNQLDSLLIRYYIDMAKYEIALKKSWELKKKSEKIMNLPFILLSISYILETLNPLGRYNECEALIETGNEIYSKILKDEDYNTQEIIGQFLFITGLIYQSLEEEKSLELYEKSLIIRKKIQDTMGIAKSLLHISNYYEKKSKYELALTYLNESLKISTLFKPNMCSAWAYIHLAYIYSKLGNPEKVLENGEKSYEISYLLGNTHCQDFFFYIIGMHYQELGQYSKSLEYFKKCLSYRKKRKNFLEISNSYYNIGNLYSYKGDLNLALEYYQKALSISQLKANSSHYIRSLMLYGKILGEKGDYENAIKNLEESLALSFKYHSFYHSSKIIYYLICISLNNQDYDKVKLYIKYSENLASNNKDNKNIIQTHKLNEALLLKNSKRYRDKIFSQNAFKQIMNEDIIQIEITIDAMLNLIEILLFELKISEDENIIEEINEIIKKLLDIGKREYSSSLFTEIIFFQAKMKLLEGNFEEARKLFIKAQDIAEQYGLVRLANDISNEHDLLLSYLNRWEESFESKVAFKKRSENVEHSFLYSKAVRNFDQNISYQKEKPIFLLIWSMKGTTLFEYQFDQSNQKLKKNLVGILSAMDIVGKEALLSEGSIDRIKYEDKTIIVRIRDQIKFAYAFQGQSYIAIKNLSLFIERVNDNLQIWNGLANSELTGEIIDKKTKNSMVSIAHEIF